MDTIKLVTPAIVEPVTAAPALTTDSKNVIPRTTAEEDLRTQGQRRVNLIWEATQASIAVCVTGAMIITAFYGKESSAMSSAFTLIIALYFQRTNHTKVGGVGGTDSR